MSTYAHDRHFTLDEARAALRDVLPLLQRLVALKESLDAKGFDVYRHQYFGGMGPNGQKFFPQELEDLVDAARDIAALGVVIKAIDTGLIDFPHLRSGGDEVYLCFQLGEPAIEYWHTLTGGFAARRPLSEL